MIKILDYFYTEKQASELLSVNRITIWRWIKKGRFNIQRIGGVVFIPRGEVDILKKKGYNKYPEEYYEYADSE